MQPADAVRMINDRNAIHLLYYAKERKMHVIKVFRCCTRINPSDTCQHIKMDVKLVLVDFIQPGINLRVFFIKKKKTVQNYF